MVASNGRAPAALFGKDLPRANHVVDPAGDTPAARASRIPVLKFVTRFDIGGTEKQVLGLAGKFGDSPFDLRFGCFGMGGPMHGKDSLLRFPIAEYPIATLLGARAVRQMLRLAADLHKDGIRVLHSYNFYANAFSIPAARLAGVPCVVASIRDMGIYLTPMQRRVQKWVCGLADAIVVNAGAIRQWLIDQGYPAHRIAVIRNGLDAPHIETDRAAALGRELGIPDGAAVVLMLARLNPQKGIEYLLEAAGRIRSRRPDTWFVIVGGEAIPQARGDAIAAGSYSARLAAIAERNGISDRVVFAGMRTDVNDFLARASVSVLPSLSEGLSNSILESMAAGVPVVATRVGGTPEIVEHRHTGLLVPPRDVEALADALLAVLGDPFLAKRLGERAKAQVALRFSFQRMYEETAALYRSVLARKCGDASPCENREALDCRQP